MMKRNFKPEPIPFCHILNITSIRNYTPLTRRIFLNQRVFVQVKKYKTVLNVEISIL